MAKCGKWLYGCTGRLAGMSLRFDAHRGYIAREIVTPHDPKTPRQLEQRRLMATVMVAYRSMKALVSDSFEGVAAGFPSLQCFKRMNLNLLRQQLDTAVAQGGRAEDAGPLTPIGSVQLVARQYFVSQGTLPGVQVRMVGAGGALAGGGGGAGAVGDYGYGGAFALDDNSYRAVLDAYGLQRGDRLTFVGMHEVQPGRQLVRLVRVVLDPHGADGLRTSLDVPLVGADGAVNMPSPENEGAFEALRYDAGAAGPGDGAEGEVRFCLDEGPMTAAGIVVSRRVGAAWLHSTCQLTL